MEITPQMKHQLNVLEEGLNAVREIIDESEGIVGLHLNGDVAYWDDLQVGGVFEDYLSPLQEAEEVLQDLKIEMGD